MWSRRQQGVRNKTGSAKSRNEMISDDFSPILCYVIRQELLKHNLYQLVDSFCHHWVKKSGNNWLKWITFMDRKALLCQTLKPESHTVFNLQLFLVRSEAGRTHDFSPFLAQYLSHTTHFRIGLNFRSVRRTAVECTGGNEGWLSNPVGSLDRSGIQDMSEIWVGWLKF